MLINDLLSETYQTDENPNPLEWVVFYYHLNQDGTIKLSNEKLCETTTNDSEKKITTYAKDFDDGTKRVRTEEIKTDKISFGELLKDMEKHAK